MTTKMWEIALVDGKPHRRPGAFRAAHSFASVGVVLVTTLLGLFTSGDVHATSSIESLRQKASSGDADAQFMLGVAYDSGQGVKLDPNEAARWYTAAAEQGNSEAQNNLGSLYLEGNGVPHDVDKAFHWFEEAAEHGNIKGVGNLAYMYDLGLGVAKDQTKANALYEKAANAGDIQSMLNLGVNYWHGEGTGQDMQKAFMWLDLARFYTQTGDANRQLKYRARAALEALTKQLSATDRAEGQRLSREWDQANRQKVLSAPHY